MATGGLSMRASTPRSTPHKAKDETGASAVTKHQKTPEENLLKSYFEDLYQFKFEHAREIYKKQGTETWCQFMSDLSKLASSESSYFSLSFMTKKSKRENTLKSTYDLLVSELKKVQEIYLQQRGGTDFSWERKLSDLLKHIIEYVSARKDMLDFYLTFDCSDGCCLDYKRLEEFIKNTSARYKTSFQHPILRPIKTLFQKELHVLEDLLQAQRSISEWQFLPAIFAIQSCNNRLHSWHGVTPLDPSDSIERRPVRSIKHFAQFQPTTERVPYLYKWWCRFHLNLLSKFSLYFNGVLSEHASVYDMKYLSQKLAADYVASFWLLLRNSSASCVCLVFDSNGIPEFNGPKYTFPDTPSPSLTGLNSYPFMISVPHDFDFLRHRANIVSTIMEKRHQLCSSAQHVCQVDETLHAIYLMTQLEELVTLVVVVVGSKGHKDRDNRISAWMSDIAMQLRNTSVAFLLRPYC